MLRRFPEVIFSFSPPPSSFPDNPYIPSAYYYYTNPAGNIISLSNTVGTEEEKQLSTQIWYSMNTNQIFPLATPYATSRNDQLGVPFPEMPNSVISLSMKDRLRQYPHSSDWFFDDHFQLLIGQLKRTTIADLIFDFYRYPLNPEADAFTVARLLEDYYRYHDSTILQEYLANRGVTHLAGHSFDYYPPYQLFFLLTRFAAPPLTEAQLVLSQYRKNSLWDSPERIFIDAVFEYPIIDVAPVIKIIDQIISQGPAAVGIQMGTPWSDWVRWADEYILDIPRNWTRPHLSIDLYKLTDIELYNLSQSLKLELPLRDQYPTRFPWVETFCGVVKRFRGTRLKRTDQGAYTIE